MGVRFEENYGLFGPAVAGNGASLSFTDVTFLRNQAETDGGAISLVDGDLSVEGGSLSDNRALGGSGGAVHVDVRGRPSASVRITRATLTGNIAGSATSAACDGGGLHVEGLTGDTFELLLEDLVVSENQALCAAGTGGGASITAAEDLPVGSQAPPRFGAWRSRTTTRPGPEGGSRSSWAPTSTGGVSASRWRSCPARATSRSEALAASCSASAGCSSRGA